MSTVWIGQGQKGEFSVFAISVVSAVKSVFMDTDAVAGAKPEQYVMVVISPAAILMAGKPGDAAFVDIRSIGGLSDDVNRQLAQKIGALLKESLGVPPDRVYLNFTDVPAGNWGWNGETFG